MIRTRNAAVALLTLTLLACGGGGGGGSNSPTVSAQAPTPAAPLAPSSKAQVLIGMYGDSTMLGKTCDVQPCTNVTTEYVISPDNVPTEIQTLMQAKYGGGLIDTDNEGLGGDNATAWLDVTGFTVPRSNWITEMQRTKAQIVVINFMINDAAQLTPQQFHDAMQSLITQAMSVGKTVVLETGNPVTDCAACTAGMPALVAIDKQLAQQYQLTLIDQYTYLSGVPSWPSLLSDGTHPTNAGYQLKAQFEFAALSPIAEKFE